MDGEVLKVGQTVQFGQYQCAVRKIFGDGNQGEVALVDIEGVDYALKWYKAGVDTPQQFENLRRLAQKGAPDPTLFLWPLAVDTSPGLPGFGYVMPVLESDFKEAKAYIAGKYTMPRRQLGAALAQIAHCLFLVHQKGMCYCDISENNFAFNPRTGGVRVFDNDNVKVDIKGSVHHTTGTPTFIAPEVVRGESEPTKETDRFGLAVLLFYLLNWCHPFEGNLLNEIPGWDPTLDLQIYGKPAPFVFHETDASNRLSGPGAAMHTKRWLGLPRFLRTRFLNAFVTTVNSPNRRDTTLNWRYDLVRLHDAVVPCPNCAAEVYYDGHKAGETTLGKCAGCGKGIPLPPRLRLTRYNDSHVMPVTATTKLYAAHIAEEEHWDMTRPMASVKAHPTLSNVFGLTNLGTEAWTGSNPDGRYFDVAPGASVVIKNQMKVTFGPSFKGEFRM